MVFRDEHKNWHAVNAVATSKKYIGIWDGGLCAIPICSNMQPQLYKQFQCKLKCNILYLAVAFLFCKILVFGLTNNNGKFIAKVLPLIFGVV